jgi:ribokinase
MIVVFGSFNIDFVMRLERLPEPGETILEGDYILVPGGKGANQACAAARASRVSGAAEGDGTRVAMVGKVGTDDWGRFATVKLEEAGADVSAVQRIETATGCAAIFVDKAGENTIVVASGANMKAEAAQVPDDLLGPDSWLVLQMEVPPEENWALIGRAKRRGARVMLNVAPAAPVPAAVLDDVDILVVNEIESRMVADSVGIASEDPLEIARRLSASHDLICLTTLGPAGAVAIGPEGGSEGSWQVDPLEVTPVDTTGAGDSFIGTLAAALDGGTDLPQALHRASVAAGLCCTRWGTQSSFAWAEEIEARLADLAPARPIP